MKSTLIILTIFLSFNFTIAQNFNLEKGLVAYYPFNGNANDESENNNHGKVYGAELTSDRFGNKNQAYFFDGRSDWIEVKSHPSIEPKDEITIVAWFQPHSVKTEWNMVITKRYYNRNPWHSYKISSSAKRGNKWGSSFNLLNGWCAIAQKDVPKMNEWTQFICTYDGKEMKLYVDGKLDGVFDCNYKLEYSNMPLRIGTDTNTPGNKFHGIIDDIRIYNRALNECEVAQLAESKNRKNLKDVSLNYISTSLQNWKTKDEYETTNDFETRIKNEASKKENELKAFILDSLENEINWICSSKKYNADKEIFEIKHSSLEVFEVSVPKNEARQFGDNYEKLEFNDIELSISDEPNLVVDCITIKNPTNDKEYKYGCEPEREEIPKDAVRVKSKIVTVKIWDDQQEDGDIVSVFLNDARIKKEISVKKSEHIFTIELNKGVNTFKLLAHNEGKNPPNTAAILIDDGNEEYKRVLSSKKDEYAELKIVLE